MVKEGSVLFNRFEVLDTLSNDPIYQWLQVRDRTDGKTRELQILSPQIAPADIRLLGEYFSLLQTVPGRHLVTPEGRFSDRDHPLVLVYRQRAGSNLKDVLQRESGQEAEWLVKATECLFALHNKGLAHGLVQPDCFRINDDELFLGGFGYAPLTSHKSSGLGNDFLECLAPEVEAGEPATPASDIYSLAITIGFLDTRYRMTNWYNKATSDQPAERHRRMRELGDQIRSEPLVESSHENDQDSGKQTPTKEKVLIIPKFFVETISEPSRGGEIQGGGKYVAGDEVKLKVITKRGWVFSHWAGSLQGQENPMTIMIENTSLRVTAHFIPETRYNLVIQVKPNHAGRVEGAGSYKKDGIVSVRAVAEDNWEFSHWEGGHTGKTNPLEFPIHHELELVAVFRPVELEAIPQIALSARCEPGKGGTVSGQGNYARGAVVTLRAIPHNGWEFSHWDGLVSGEKNPVQVTVAGNSQVIAKFVRVATANIIAVSKPAGAGFVTGVGSYPFSSNVRLQAKPVSSFLWHFDHWEGDASGTDSNIDLTINRDMQVTACFLRREVDISAVVEPTGSGNISGCGKYLIGVSISLSATPKTGYVFSHWTGGVESTEKSVQLKVEGAKQMVAHFRKKVGKTGIGIFTDTNLNRTEKPTSGEREHSSSESKPVTRQPLGEAFKKK
jgi:hypothetical protein